MLVCAVHVDEFILINCCAFQDLQVKSSPPAQSEEPIHNDPAIIQVLTLDNI